MKPANRCPECARKFAQRGTATHVERLSILWQMQYGFDDNGSPIIRAAYCNTCGARNDPRRKADPRSGHVRPFALRTPMNEWKTVYRDDSEGRDLAWARTSACERVREAVAACDVRDRRDLAWARRDPSPLVRILAAGSDADNGRDLAWARTDPGASVRYVAAMADADNGRDLAWARRDPETYVRKVERADSRGGP